MQLPPTVVVHGLEHARMALRPGLPVLLLSGPGAACYAGPGWWRALIAAAINEGAPQPDAIDCDDQAGRALEALFMGCGIVILHPCPAFPSVAGRAGGAAVLQARPPALDLRLRGAGRHLDAWLSGDNGAVIV